jgi:hypothetical protein
MTNILPKIVAAAELVEYHMQAYVSGLEDLPEGDRGQDHPVLMAHLQAAQYGMQVVVNALEVCGPPGPVGDKNRAVQLAEFEVGRAALVEAARKFEAVFDWAGIKRAGFGREA